ncbi:uncharacterized protein V1516DRAFT_682312 [Lipomyces oligophaga]|uniref:uncharacterized protein n=1 Tax=Lipomyces oligophaga TaxID=45792 RepID=UPI0034CD3206
MAFDQTPLFYELCRAACERRGRQWVLQRTGVDGSEAEHKVDVFTEEARQIYQHIVSLQGFVSKIRPAYLNVSSHSYSSTLNFQRLDAGAGLSDAQRDEIDYESRLIIQQCTARVRKLEKVAAAAGEVSDLVSGYEDNDGQVSKLTRMLLPGVTVAREARGRANTLGLHRRGITQMLNKMLKEVSEAQTDMQEVRLSRASEKAKSALNSRISTVLGNVTGGSYSSDKKVLTMQQLLAEEEDASTSISDEVKLEREMDTEMLQELETENTALLAEFQDRLDQAEQAEKSLYEIASLQSELAMHLAEQSEKTEQLYTDAGESIGDVQSANTQLQSARKRNRLASKAMITMALFLAFFILFVDYATS